MKETTTKERKTDKENTPGKMVASIRVNGETIK